MNRENVKRILIKLEVDQVPQFYVALGSDGYVMRMGPIDMDGTERTDMFVGQTSAEFFPQLLEAVDNNVWKLVGGRIEMPEPQGRACELTIAFTDGRAEIGFQLVYGSDSEGPNDSVVALVDKARTLTQAWYDEQFTKVAR